MLGDPEVRSLVSKDGDPNEPLSEVWCCEYFGGELLITAKRRDYETKDLRRHLS